MLSLSVGLPPRTGSSRNSSAARTASARSQASRVTGSRGSSRATSAASNGAPPGRTVRFSEVASQREAQPAARDAAQEEAAEEFTLQEGGDLETTQFEVEEGEETEEAEAEEERESEAADTVHPLLATQWMPRATERDEEHVEDDAIAETADAELPVGLRRPSAPQAPPAAWEGGSTPQGAPGEDTLALQDTGRMPNEDDVGATVGDSSANQENKDSDTPSTLRQDRYAFVFSMGKKAVVVIHDRGLKQCFEI